MNEQGNFDPKIVCNNVHSAIRGGINTSLITFQRPPFIFSDHHFVINCPISLDDIF